MAFPPVKNYGPEVGAKTKYFEVEAAEHAVLNALRAMGRQSKSLAESDYTCSMTVRQLRSALGKQPEQMAEMLGVGVEQYEKWEIKNNPHDVAKTMAYTARMIDDIYRLLSFSQGGPDHRQEFQLGDLLKYLTAEQFETFTRWIEEGKERGLRPQVEMQ